MRFFPLRPCYRIFLGHWWRDCLTRGNLITLRISILRFLSQFLPRLCPRFGSCTYVCFPLLQSLCFLLRLRFSLHLHIVLRLCFRFELRLCICLFLGFCVCLHLCPPRLSFQFSFRGFLWFQCYILILLLLFFIFTILLLTYDNIFENLLGGLLSVHYHVMVPCV